MSKQLGNHRLLFLTLLIAAPLLWAATALATPFFQITSDSNDQMVPATSGNRIVWQHDGAGVSAIYGRNTNGTTAKISGSGSFKNPRVDGNIVVYEKLGSGADRDIWMYNYGNGNESLVAGTAAQQLGPDVAGSRIVWYEGNGAVWNIKLKDMSAGGTFSLTTLPTRSIYPRISGDLVVWAEKRYGSSDIFYYDLSKDTDGDGTPNYRDGDAPNPDPAEKRLPNSSQDNEDLPDVDGKRVVWRRVQKSTGDILLEYYDTAAPGAGVRQIARVKNPFANPRITLAGNHVVYTGTSSSPGDTSPDIDIYSYNMNSKVMMVLVSGAGTQGAPDMSGRRLVYQDNSAGSQYDVHGFDFDDSLPAAPAWIKADDTARGRQIKVSWAPSGSDDVYRYQVYRWAADKPLVRVATTSGRHYYDNGVTQSRFYRYRVRAIDFSGNRGKLSTAFGSAKATDKLAPGAPVISSPTHPKAKKWYRSNDPRFTWTVAPDRTGIKGYSVVLDHRPLTVPDRRMDRTAPARTIMNRSDGVWYFHVRVRDKSGNWGPAAHRAAKIDAHRPRTAMRFPSNKSVRVSRDAIIKLRFKDISNIARSSLNAKSFYLINSRTGKRVFVMRSFAKSSRTARLFPSSRLASRTWYRVRATTAIKDYVYLKFVGNSWTFRTGKK